MGTIIARSRPATRALFATLFLAAFLPPGAVGAAGAALDRFNGFETGGPGNYASVGLPAGSPTARTGSFGLSTSAAPGSDEYVSVSLSAAGSVITDAIAACVDTPPTAGRRIRSWLAGGSPVVELILNFDRKIALNVGKFPVAISITAVRTCDAGFTVIRVRYDAGGGTASLQLDDNAVVSGTHSATALIDATRIGPDDGAATAVAVVWDDHGITRAADFPTDLHVAGLPARPLTNPSDPGAAGDWIPSVGCPQAVDCIDEQPPDGDDTFLATSVPSAAQSLCFRPAAGGGVFGNILGVKHLLVGRGVGGSAEVGMALRFNAPSCGGSFGTTSLPATFPLDATFVGFARRDSLNGATAQQWTESDLNATELVLSYLSGTAEARATQLIREVAFDPSGFPSPTPTATITATPTITATKTSTATVTATPPATPTETRTATPTLTSSATPSPSATFTASPSATATFTITLTSTPSATASESATPTLTRTPSPSPPPSATPTVTATGTITDTPTDTATPTATHTATSTPTPTATATATATPTPFFRNLNRVNGFEGGWVGDYRIGAGTPGISAAARSGDFSLETTSSGDPVYITAALTGATDRFTDGFWACTVSSPVSPTRVRHWLSGSESTVQLILDPDDTVTAIAGAVTLGTSTATMAACPNFTHYEVRYESARNGGTTAGTFALRIDGITEFNVEHSLQRNVDTTRIGFDESIGSATSLRWDDHTISRSLVWPGDLNIVALPPTADGYYTAWEAVSGACGDPGIFTCVNPRPPVVTHLALSNVADARASFCHGATAEDGITGAVFAVKFLVYLLGDPALSGSGGLFLRTEADPCGATTAIDTAEIPVAVDFDQAGFFRLDEANPATGQPWLPSQLDHTEFGIRHPTDSTLIGLTQAILEVVFDPSAETPPTPTPTLTPAPPTLTPSITPTFTITQTPSLTPTPTPSGTPTATPTSSATIAAGTSATPSASATQTLTATPSLTSTDTPAPTPTAPTPTPTATFPPRSDFIIPEGENGFACTRDAVLELGFSSFGPLMNALATTEDPVLRHAQFLAVYVAPGLSGSDYGFLRLLSQPGGFIDQFVSLGGVAVINVAGDSASQPNIAPRGVGFEGVAFHNQETIVVPAHPYIAGAGYGGEPLTEASFSTWGPTDQGRLTAVPADATVVLSNIDGPSWIEYVHGNGKVIVTTLNYCTAGRAATQGPAFRNLVKFSRFFQGGALTPAPTVTSTPTSTATFTGQPSSTPTRTRTPVPPTPTSTAPPTNTPTPRPGDVDGDGDVDASDLDTLIAALFAPIPPLSADVNQDGAVDGADVPALLLRLQ